MQSAPADGTTVLATLPAALLEAAAAAGYDAEALRRAAGLAPDALEDPDARIPLERHAALWEALSRLPGDVGLQLGPRLSFRALGVVGHAMAASSTVGEALLLLGRYRRLVLEPALPRLELREGPDGEALACLVQPLPPRFLALRHPAETQAAASLTVLRHLAGAGLTPRAVSFPHSAPPSTRAHAALFRCPLHWGAAETELVVEAEVLARPVARADPALRAYLTRHADAMLAGVEAQGPPAWSARVRQRLLERLPHGEPTVGALARDLAVSVRTLHRRLEEEGTGYSALLEALRRERAEALLADPHLSVSEAAFLLGYSEPAAFTRAFRRWTGSAPREWRASR